MLVPPVPFTPEQLEAERLADEAETRILTEYLNRMRGLPSSDDLDRVTEETSVRERTSHDCH